MVLGSLARSRNAPAYPSFPLWVQAGAFCYLSFFLCCSLFHLESKVALPNGIGPKMFSAKCIASESLSFTLPSKATLPFAAFFHPTPLANPRIESWIFRLAPPQPASSGDDTCHDSHRGALSSREAYRPSNSTHCASRPLPHRCYSFRTYRPHRYELGYPS